MSQMGIVDVGTGTWNANYKIAKWDSDTLLYDVDGHGCCYINLTAVDETGTVVHKTDPLGLSAGYMAWRNGSGIPAFDDYALYYDTAGEKLVDGDLTSSDYGSGFAIDSSLGIIVIVTIFIIVAGVVGLRVFGIGIADESVSMILKGSMLLAIWGIFSLLAMGMITSVPLLGPFFYLFLTLVYGLGVINQVGHPGED